MCFKTVYQYNHAGAAGLHLEDQVFPKRCGHLDGKTLIEVDHMAEKVKAAAEASEQCSDGDFVVCARTDARGVQGIESTIHRAKKYMDAGASMIFPEGLQSLDEFQYVSGELRAHNPEILLLANMTEFGKTPLINFKDFKNAGYSCVIYPVSTLRIAMKAVEGFLEVLKVEETQESQVDKMLTRKELYNLLKYDPSKEWYYPNSSKKGQK